MRWQPKATVEHHKKDMAQRLAALEREAAEAAEQDDRLAEAIAYNNMGAVYADLADWDHALERYRQAATTVPDSASLEDRATPHGNAANAARQLDDWAAALAHALQVELLAAAENDSEQRLVADGAVALVRRALPAAEFETLLDAAIAELPEEQRGTIRRDDHLRPTVVAEQKAGRNDPCPCGSGKKYKHCCLKQAAGA